MDDTKSNYQLIITNTISEKRGKANLWKQQKFCISRLNREAQIVWCRYLNIIGWFNTNLECDLLIQQSHNKLSNNKLYDDNLASELVKNRRFLNQLQFRNDYTL